MFSVTLNTATPPYVLSYEVMSPFAFAKKYGTGTPTNVYLTPTDLSTASLQSFVSNPQAFYYQNNRFYPTLAML